MKNVKVKRKKCKREELRMNVDCWYVCMDRRVFNSMVNGDWLDGYMDDYGDLIIDGVEVNGVKFIIKEVGNEEV